MKKIISFIVAIAMITASCCPISAKERTRFMLWTDNIFENNNQYDVVDRTGTSVKNQFFNDNILNYNIEDYDSISNYCIENGYTYTRNSVVDKLGIESYASRPNYVFREYLDQFTQNNKTITVQTILESTLRINDATGVITSYSGPYLSLVYDDAGYAFTTNLIDATTNAVLSSTRRTITISCSYRVQSVASFQEGGVVLTYTSPVFNHSFVEG